MRGFRIGRLFGIDLRADWSWMFIFLLLTWNLVAVFSFWHPEWTALGAFAVAACASLVFFGCVLLHELAHSIVAKRYGIPVRGITLFLFGGVSNIEREPPSPKVEFLMAIVGPITSLLIGVAAILVTSLALARSMTDTTSTIDAFAELGPVTTLLAWLGPINITIGLFNLIPGYPLDGGRVLRSILWAATGDLRRATQWASAVGQAVGWLFIALGVAMAFGAYVPFFGTGLVGGLWLAFIGWFLYTAAAQAQSRLALDDALAGMSVLQMMQRSAPVASPDMTVATLVHRHLLSGDDRALPVVQDGELVGVVSVADVQKVPPDRWDVTPVGSIMEDAAAIPVARPDEPLAEAFEKLVKKDIDQMPVVQDGHLVGMLRRRDITRWLELAWRPGRHAPSHA